MINSNCQCCAHSHRNLNKIGNKKNENIPSSDGEDVFGTIFFCTFQGFLCSFACTDHTMSVCCSLCHFTCCFLTVWCCCFWQPRCLQKGYASVELYQTCCQDLVFLVPSPLSRFPSAIIIVSFSPHCSCLNCVMAGAVLEPFTNIKISLTEPSQLSSKCVTLTFSFFREWKSTPVTCCEQSMDILI